MRSERDRIRRILGMELAEAGRKAGVTGPIVRRPAPERGASEAQGDELLYFVSFDEILGSFDAWKGRQ